MSMRFAGSLLLAIALLAGCAQGDSADPQATGPFKLPLPPAAHPLQRTRWADTDNRALIGLAPEADWIPVWDGSGGCVGTPEAQELHVRAAAGELTPDDWTRLLENQRVVRTRQRWPRGEPFRAQVAPPFWLEERLEFRLTSSLPGRAVVRRGSTWTVVSSFGRSPADAEALDLGKGLIERVGPLGLLRPSDDAIDMRLEIRSAGLDWSKRWDHAAVVCTAELHRSVTQVGSVDEAISPVRNAETDLAVSRALRVGVQLAQWTHASGTHTRSQLTVAIERRTDELLRGLGLGLKLDLMRDRKVVERVELWGDMPWQWQPGRYQTNSIELPGLKGWYARLDDKGELARWTLRVRGDGRLALTAWDCDRYWAGEYIVPLAHVLSLD